jgi:uncharacterized protein (DUF1501 family)
MATTAKPPVLVVLQLSGGNDYMNTVVPYKDPLYWDYRPRVALAEDQPDLGKSTLKHQPCCA